MSTLRNRPRIYVYDRGGCTVRILDYCYHSTKGPYCNTVVAMVMSYLFVCLHTIGFCQRVTEIFLFCLLCDQTTINRFYLTTIDVGLTACLESLLKAQCRRQASDCSDTAHLHTNYPLLPFSGKKKAPYVPHSFQTRQSNVSPFLSNGARPLTFKVMWK